MLGAVEMGGEGGGWIWVLRVECRNVWWGDTPKMETFLIVLVLYSIRLIRSTKIFLWLLWRNRSEPWEFNFVSVAVDRVGGLDVLVKLLFGCFPVMKALVGVRWDKETSGGGKRWQALGMSGNCSSNSTSVSILVMKSLSITMSNWCDMSSGGCYQSHHPGTLLCCQVSATYLKLR